MQDFGTKADNSPPPGGQLSAAEFNNLATENENAVLRSGQALSGSSELQLAEALFLNGVKADGFQDSGTVNTYVATPISGSSGVMLPADYAPLNGATISFVASTTNTGASTLNLGQTTGTLLGAKAIRTQAGAAIPANSIVAGQHVQFRFNSALDAGAGAWVLMPWAFSALSAHGIAVFNTPGVTNWTVPAGVTRCRVLVTGGGGGTGGVPNTSVSATAISAGGGAGGTAIKVVSLIGVSSVSVTVGAGGAAGAIGSSTGGTGGTSSFGAFCSATGGEPTTGNSATSNNASSAGGLGGIATGGDLNLPGGDGTGAITVGGELAPIANGTGGSSYWGGGPRQAFPGVLYGTGGGPRAQQNSGTQQPGLAGASGVVVVEW